MNGKLIISILLILAIICISLFYFLMNRRGHDEVLFDYSTKIDNSQKK